MVAPFRFLDRHSLTVIYMQRVLISITRIVLWIREGSVYRRDRTTVKIVAPFRRLGGHPLIV